MNIPKSMSSQRTNLASSSLGPDCWEEPPMDQYQAVVNARGKQEKTRRSKHISDNSKDSENDQQKSCKGIQKTTTGRQEKDVTCLTNLPQTVKATSNQLKIQLLCDFEGRLRHCTIWVAFSWLLTMSITMFVPWTTARSFKEKTMNATPRKSF